MKKFIEHRIADRRVILHILHIKKWLNAGVLEDAGRTYSEEGVPRGGARLIEFGRFAVRVTDIPIATG